MQWIGEMTCQEWMYVIVKITGIIGLLYVAFSSMINSNKSIIRKSYNTLPDMKVFGVGKQDIILNIPMDVIHQNLRENTSLFLGFLVSAIGFFLDMVIETTEVDREHLLILAIPISVICYVILYFISEGMTLLRCMNIMHKVEQNRIKPIAYNINETDNVDDANGVIHTSLYVKNCSWERQVIGGKVEDKNTEE